MDPIDKIKMEKVLRIIAREGSETEAEWAKEQIEARFNEYQSHPDWYNSAGTQEIADYYLAHFPGKKIN